MIVITATIAVIDYCIIIVITIIIIIIVIVIASERDKRGQHYWGSLRILNFSIEELFGYQSVKSVKIGYEVFHIYHNSTNYDFKTNIVCLNNILPEG